MLHPFRVSSKSTAYEESWIRCPPTCSVPLPFKRLWVFLGGLRQLALLGLPFSRELMLNHTMKEEHVGWTLNYFPFTRTDFCFCGPELLPGLYWYGCSRELAWESWACWLVFSKTKLLGGPGLLIPLLPSLLPCLLLFWGSSFLCPVNRPIFLVAIVICYEARERPARLSTPSLFLHLCKPVLDHARRFLSYLVHFPKWYKAVITAFFFFFFCRASLAGQLH